VSVAAPPAKTLMVLMFTDIVESVTLKRRIGDAAAARLIRMHDQVFHAIVGDCPDGAVLKDTGDGFLASFATASDAVQAALRFQHELHERTAGEAEPLKVRIGVHLGEVSQLDAEAATGRPKLSGYAVDLTARVMSLALPGQILMTRAAFDNARQYIRHVPWAAAGGEAAAPKWMAHGAYLFKGADEPVEVFEVGEFGRAPLAVPPGSEKARRAVSLDQEETLGWRPAAGLMIPGRKGWMLERKLGEGGFGEVWLGLHERTQMRRVFKFCFDAERLRSFKRELVLFRLLRDSLGDRPDIAKLFEAQVDKPPFYLESEFTEDGSLLEWAEGRGGIDRVPMATRLDIMIRTAQAAAAAHSVGILHKDIKPSNILIYRGDSGEPMPRLTDFGIGVLTDRSQLEKSSIAMTSVTESLVSENDSSRTGTRLYAPPEVLIGRPFTMQGDVYALGVLLYQLVVADLARPLAQGWERDVADAVLREDIARCVEGNERDRLGSATELVERLTDLPLRHRARRRRRAARVAYLATVVLAVMLLVIGAWLVREQRLRRATEHEAAKVRAVNTFLQQMLTSVDPREGGGRNVKVVDILDRAASTVAVAYADDPEIEASLHWAIGNAYRGIEQWESAERELTTALEMQRQALRAPHADIAQTLEDLGAVRWWMRDFEGSRVLQAEALRMREALFGRDDLRIASSLNYLAACDDSLGQWPQAETLHREALAIRRRLAVGRDRELIARSLNNLATCLRRQGRFEEAQPLYLETIEILRELRGPEHMDVAGGLNNLGNLLFQQGRFTEAEPLLREALAIKRNSLGEHSSTALTLYLLGRLLFEQNRLVEAETTLLEALAMRRAVLAPEHPDTVATIRLVAAVHQHRGEFEKAEPLLREALDALGRAQPVNERELAALRQELQDCLDGQASR
jgi:serine/threonine-protein kinase